MDEVIKKEILKEVKDFLTLDFQHIVIEVANNGFSILPTKTSQKSRKVSHE